MKHQYYIVLALMLLSGVAWGDGYWIYYGATNGSPSSTTPPTPTPNPANVPQLYDSQGNYLGPITNNPHRPNAASNAHQHYGNPHSAYSNSSSYGTGNPYTPYSSSNPYNTNGNPYSTDSINTPYNDSPDNERNQYRSYGIPYTPNAAATPYSPNSINNLYAPNNPYNPYNVTYPYESYATPYDHNPP